MKIAFIGPFGLRPKSTMSRRALPMAQALAARGHTLHLILPPWDCPQDTGQTWDENGVRIHNIPLPPRIPLLQHLLITCRLVQEALAIGPDVIHCFKPIAYAGLVATIFWFTHKLRLTKARLVIDADDWEDAWSEIRDYPWLLKSFLAFQERWGLTHCQAVTVASRALETIVWSLGVAPDRVFYVPNGIPFRRSCTPSADDVRGDHQLADCPVILLYTRFVEFAVEHVIDILRRVLDEVPETRLLVVGKGFSGEEERLLALAGEAGIAHRVTYAGWIDASHLPAYLAAAHVAIYPCNDNLINRAKCAVRLIDLMAAGLPVVAEGVGEVRTYIEPHVSGLLVEPGDVETFAHDVIQLLRDEELRAKIGRGARQRIRQGFNWEKLVETVESAYLLGS